MTDHDLRPSPEALLDTAKRESRGRLKIFLGAAPGVGKTYEMLLTARARKREGVDVVVGVAETHGREETGRLLDGFEILPRARVDYRGHVLDEMDIDAILARRPQLALVDELAHTNAPGSRHPKRYLDVQELIAAGIDVYTTLNIQHVESLNDIVARITRIRVRETVPDTILDQADDIEVVDLSPEDLIHRLREGKVYVPKQAERALQHYFSPGNLTALRELALRRTADRVDAQLLTHMQAHAIRGPWPAGERVLVCINQDARAAGLVRHAKRMADRLHAPWTAVFVETRRAAKLSEDEQDRIADALRLAERLDGEAITLPGETIVEEVLAYARARNVTQIVVGKSDRARWFEILNGSIVHDLIRCSDGISVHVMAGEEVERDPIRGKTVRTASRPESWNPRPWVVVPFAIGAALGIGLLLKPFFGLEAVDLVFLTAVISIAVGYGLIPSLAASVVAMMAYNFFFLPPLHTFTITDPTNVASLFVFLLVSVLVSNLTARVRTQAMAARNRARTTEALYAFSRKIAAIGGLDDLLWATAYQIAAMLKLDVVLLLPDADGRLAVKAAYPPEDWIDEADLGAAKWAWETNRPAGRGADTLPGAKHLFLPLRTGRGPLGVAGIRRDRPGPLLTPDERRLLDALTDQAAVALERVRLAREMDAARVEAESERLRAALLTSLSHDLKTPLASIIGAITALREFGPRYDETERDELAATIQDEADRLNRFVVNLLDMTRLEAGGVSLKKEPIDLGEAVGAALARTGRVLADHRVTVDLASDLPMLDIDPVLFEQVLINLLENAGKYAPAGSNVTIAGRAAGPVVEISVSDEGPGIAPENLERIFEKFYQAENGDRRRGGGGLGLAICRGFVTALGGRISAANRTDRRGAVFTIALPGSAMAADATK